jgi:predicted GH43/DUF377 family glycosyl hydrolase
MSAQRRRTWLVSRPYGRDLLHRWEGNPAISPEDIPFPCNTVFNGAPVKIKDVYHVLLRVEGREGYSVLALAKSDDGLHFEVEPEPVLTPSKDGPFERHEHSGVEDPRITVIDGTIYVAYTAVGDFGPRIALAKTENLHEFERIAIVSEPGNKDCVLFPRKIKGRYARLDRPYGHGIGNVWVSYSKDLLHWGDSRVVLEVRPGHWDMHRVGASTVPIETEHGWFEIYHGVKLTSGGPIYRLGVALLDLDDPSKVLHRADIPILTPREEYERIGDINNVVFASGAILEPDGEIKVYYGAADTCICVATAQLNELIERCKEHGK